MRCEDARRRLLAGAGDREASRHLEACPACFDVLEAADPLTGALRAARPAGALAPAGMAGAVLARWRPGGSRARTALAAVLAVAAVVAVAAIELLVGAEPARLAGLGAVVAALADAGGGALAALAAVRSAVADAPGLLTVLSAVTLAACALWVRLTLRVPAWRSAR